MIQYSALDKTTIVQALTDYVKANFPDQRDFTASAGFTIITNEIAYVADLLSYRADYLANNNYLPCATNLRALDNLLALIGYQRDGVNPAITTVVIVPQQVTGNPNIPAQAGLTIRIPVKTTIQGVGIDGSAISFELFASPSNIYDDIEIPTGAANVTAYAVQGVSKTVTVISTGQPFQQVTIADLEVITGSLRLNAGVYDPTDPSLGTTYDPNLPAWEQVPYVVTYGQENIFEAKLKPDGTTVITFGDGNFGNVVPVGQSIIINYRVGGGSAGNVLPQALTGNGNFPIYNSGLLTPNSVSCSMTNTARGVGGRDEEGIEDAKFLAPLVYQTQGRAVKDIDFTAIALNNPIVYKAIAVSRQAIRIDSFEDPTSWNFPLFATQPYTISLVVHRFDLRTSKTYTASVKVPQAAYTDPSALIIDLNKALGWTYDQDSLAFTPTVNNQQFIGYFDLSIDGYIEFWVNTGDYQARVTINPGGNALLPILAIPPGSYGRVDGNYIDIHVLTYADDGNVSVPNAAAASSIATYFTQYQEIVTDVTVRRAFIKRVDIKSNVYIDKTADPITLKNAINTAILGIFDPSKRNLGQPLHVSDIVAAITAIPGVSYIDQFSPSQNVFPDAMTILQAGTINILFYTDNQ